MGKGSNRRPSQIDEAEAQANWDRIFGKKEHLNQLLKDDRDGFNVKDDDMKPMKKDNGKTPGKKGKKC